MCYIVKFVSGSVVALKKEKKAVKNDLSSCEFHMQFQDALLPSVTLKFFSLFFLMNAGFMRG